MRLTILFVVAFFTMAFYARPLSASDVRQLLTETVYKYQLNAPVEVLTSMAGVESSYRYWVIGDGGKAYGLFQVWQSTAKDLYERLGYKEYHYNLANLLRPEVSAYFASAYFDWLNQVDHDKPMEWKVRAYNGGRGWEKTELGPTNTAIYWEKVKNGLNY